MKESVNIGLPPYCIFDNKSLEELTKYLPTTHEELKCIYGFKEIKCEKYGDAILKIISDFLKKEAEFTTNNCLKIVEYSPDNKLKIFEKVQDAIDFINDVLNKTYKEKYPITDFTEELNVDDKTIILRCEGYTSNLKNIIRIFCEQNKSFECDFINGQFNLIRKSEQQIQKELEIEEIQQQKNKIYAEKVSQIKEYILNQNKWVEITELEKLFGLKRRGKFIKDDNLSTVAHLINRFLKKEGFLTKRINSEFDYSIWVAGPDISLESLPAESESYTKNEEENNTVVFDDEQFTPFIDENEAIKIIEIATKDELDYDAKLSILQMEFGEIQDEHTNFESIGKFGSLNQYILEAYCVINNFTTRKWISANKINLDLLVIDAEPIEFQILRENGKPSQYCLYNLCQTAEYKETHQTKISTKEGDIIVTKKDITDAILGLISKYDGILGRVATIKILTGNFDEDEHNIKQNEYYNKFPDRYANVITTIINKLVKNNRLSLNEKYRLCFVSPKEEIDNKEDERDFLKIVQLIKQEKNIFVTGNAGTGKSYLLNKLKSKYKKRLELTSTTGLAAVNIKGVTIHSWAGIGICKKDIFKCVQDILGKKQLSKKIRNCDLLAIDEISMLKGHTFSYIDQVLRMVRECDKPFGGIQLLLFGDFFQLPPVEETGNEKDFCFETQTWKELDLEVVKLETIYRQTELPFIKALNNIRINKPDEEDIKLLKSREIDYDTTDTTMLHIFSRNEEADSYNLKKFNALTNPLYQFNATSGVYRGEKYIQTDLNDREKLTLEIFKKNCRASEHLCLKKGSRVMLLINLDFDKGLINGSCGEITALSPNSVTVLFDNGVETTIEQNKFEYYYNDALVATMMQYPLKLAYAITIHKSQGMTLENVVVDCNRIFEEGQTYVALSRVKKLNGLYLKGFSSDKIKVNQKVVDYYQTI